jgi:hypothetical protein
VVVDLASQSAGGSVNRVEGDVRALAKGRCGKVPVAYATDGPVAVLFWTSAFRTNFELLG